MAAPIDHITSTSNPVVKFLKGLDRKKNRREHGVFLVEGARLIQEGLDKGWGLHTLIAGSATDSDHVERIIERASRTTARVVTTTPKVLAAVSRKDNPQTVLAAFEQRERAREDLCLVQRSDQWR